MSDGNPINNPFGTPVAAPSGPVAGQSLEMKIYDCAVNTATYGQHTYIQQVNPNFTIESGDQQVVVQGVVKMYRQNSNPTFQNLVYVALDHSSDGGTTYNALASTPSTMFNGGQIYNSYPVNFVHTPGAGNHRYRLRLYSPSNVTLLLGVSNNNGCQMTFTKRHMPAALVTTNVTSSWTFNTTPPS
jgi:hypothetical protein